MYWASSENHGQLCQVIESETVWDDTTFCIWLTGSDSVFSVTESRLALLEDSGMCTADDIAYAAAAARVADALTQNVLLAPIESSVIPLPHGMRAGESLSGTARTKGPRLSRNGAHSCLTSRRIQQALIMLCQYSMALEVHNAS